MSTVKLWTDQEVDADPRMFSTTFVPREFPTL